jgi:hypothetical protein
MVWLILLGLVVFCAVVGLSDKLTDDADLKRQLKIDRAREARHRAREGWGQW